MSSRKYLLRVASLLAGITALLAVSAPALATPLLAGSAVDCFNVRAGSPWVFVADHVAPFSDGITGTFNAWVFHTGTLANPALAFEFQARTNSSSDDYGSGRVTMVNLPALGWFPLELFYRMDSGETASPANATTGPDSKRGEFSGPAGGDTASERLAVQGNAGDSAAGPAEGLAAEGHAGEVGAGEVRGGEVHTSANGGGTSKAWPAGLPATSDGENGNPSPVPEPLTLVLMGSGLVALGFLRTFKSRS